IWTAGQNRKTSSRRPDGCEQASERGKIAFLPSDNPWTNNERSKQRFLMRSRSIRKARKWLRSNNRCECHLCGTEEIVYNDVATGCGCLQIHQLSHLDGQCELNRGVVLVLGNRCQLDVDWPVARPVIQRIRHTQFGQN